MQGLYKEMCRISGVWFKVPFILHIDWTESKGNKDTDKSRTIHLRLALAITMSQYVVTPQVLLTFELHSVL